MHLFSPDPFQHRKQNPTAKYEILAELKSTPEGEKRIVIAVAGAGITLEHFWVPRGDWSPGMPVGPHGLGYVDVIDSYRAIKPK